MCKYILHVDILLIEFLGQVFIVEVAQVLFGCASLSFKQWLFCLAVGCTELVIGQIITALPVGWVDPFIALFVRSNQFLGLDKSLNFLEISSNQSKLNSLPTLFPPCQQLKRRHQRRIPSQLLRKLLL